MEENDIQSTQQNALPPFIQGMQKDLADAIERAKNLRALFRKKIDEHAAALPEEVQALLKNEIGSFGEADDALKNMEKLLEERFWLFWNNLFSELCAGDMRLHNAFWLLGDDFLSDVRAELEKQELYDLSKALRGYVFTFDDLAHLDDRAVQKMMREVDCQELAKALKGASEETKAKIFSNMSKRAAAMLEEDMDIMASVTQRDIRNSQRKILSVIERLQDAGEIVIPRFERTEDVEDLL
ncbi:MAG: hypothetical protein K6G80_01155 [Treponema sp.]|nr:hypothetical protein [Treponema sp.]